MFVIEVFLEKVEVEEDEGCQVMACVSGQNNWSDEYSPSVRH